MISYGGFSTIAAAFVAIAQKDGGNITQHTALTETRVRLNFGLEAFGLGTNILTISM